LIAWDPVQQREAWYVQHAFFFNGGTLSTGGGLVFQGTADGNFTGYDDTTGRQVWQFYAGMGIISAPISYEVAGKQYISVLAGFGASAGAAQTMRVGWKYRMPRRLMTFALDAHAMLPSVATRDLNIQPVDDPNLEINPTDAAAGAKLARRCWGCHGGNLQSAGTAPDLRESTIALDPQSFWAVVHEGVLIQNGMPEFDNFTRDEVNQIRAYIRTRAREALNTKPP
jgi:quinohemoprotein ethanol dehydrogenase